MDKETKAELDKYIEYNRAILQALENKRRQEIRTALKITAVAVIALWILTGILFHYANIA